MNTQFSMPLAGSRVAITFEFPSYVLVGPKVNKTTISGVVETATKFTPPDFVRIITDFDSPVRIREVPLNRIIQIEYADGTQAPQQAINNETKTWVVEGSRGSRYTVIRNKSSWSCTCPGFQFRRSCKHVQELKDA
jgi:hypothetical protein